MTLDAPVDPELNWISACPVRAGRPSGRAVVARDDLGVAAQPVAAHPGRCHHELGRDPVQRAVHLVLGQPVVQQTDLGADPPRGQQHRHVGQRRRQAQRDRAAGSQAGGCEVAFVLGDDGAQRGAVDGTVEPQTRVRVRTGEQDVIDPVGVSAGL